MSTPVLVTLLLILSEPHLSTSNAIDLDADAGIAAIPSKPPGHGSHLSSSIDDGIRTVPGEQFKKTRGFEMYWDRFWGAVQDLAFASKDPAGIIRALTETYRLKLKGTRRYLVRLVGE